VAIAGLALSGLACTGTATGRTDPGDEPGAGGDDNPSGGKGGKGGKGGTSANGGEGYGGDPGTGGTPPLPGSNQAGPAPLRRLTIAEFNNTVRDLLGADVPVITGEEGFSADTEAWTRGFMKGSTVGSSNDARLYLELADKISTAGMAHIATLAPQGCGAPAAAGETECAKQFISQFGLRAYRRPLDSGEQSDLLDLYNKLRASDIGLTYPEAIRALIAGMLQSPMFGYRWELGTAALKDGPLVKLNDYEIASRLSYMTLASMPDAELFTAAAAGGLTDPDKIAAQARRLLASPKAKAGLSEFITQWLGVTGLPMLSKDDTFTKYTPEVGASMVKETGLFFASLLQSGTGKLEELYTSTNTFADGPLAALYGIPGVTGTEMKPVKLDPTQRAGILTQGSYLASQSEGDHPHPIHRGLLVLDKVICQPVAPLKDFVPPAVRDVMPGVSNRKRYEDSTSVSPTCAACHTTINGVGFAFENYDAVGQYRTDDQGPVNASGTVPLNDKDFSFRNALEFAKAVSTSSDARTCFVTQFLEYSLRRPLLPNEAGSVDVMTEAFAKSGYDLRELLVATTKTLAFTHRQPLAGEGQP